jgi:hypothetical protein
MSGRRSCVLESFQNDQNHEKTYLHPAAVLCAVLPRATGKQIKSDGAHQLGRGQVSLRLFLLQPIIVRHPPASSPHENECHERFS